MLFLLQLCFSIAEDYEELEIMEFHDDGDGNLVGTVVKANPINLIEVVDENEEEAENDMFVEEDSEPKTVAKPSISSRKFSDLAFLRIVKASAGHVLFEK